MSKREDIAVIGAGLMGHGIAQIFAVHGHPVFLMDLDDTLLSNAIESIRANLVLMAQNGTEYRRGDGIDIDFVGTPFTTQGFGH